MAYRVPKLPALELICKTLINELNFNSFSGTWIKSRSWLPEGGKGSGDVYPWSMPGWDMVCNRLPRLRLTSFLYSSCENFALEILSLMDITSSKRKQRRYSPEEIYLYWVMSCSSFLASAPENLLSKALFLKNLNVGTPETSPMSSQSLLSSTSTWRNTTSLPYLQIR